MYKIGGILLRQFLNLEDLHEPNNLIQINLKKKGEKDFQRNNN